MSVLESRGFVSGGGAVHRLLLMFAVVLAIIGGATSEAYAVDSTIVASGTYVGYAATTDCQLDSHDSYAYLPKYSWTLYNDGLLSLSLDDYHATYYSGDLSQNPEWKSYSSAISKITINVKSSYYNYGKNGYYTNTINRYMFSGLENLVEVDAPFTKIVGNNAFFGCPQLQRVNIGSSFAPTSGDRRIEIGSSAFANCPSLSEVNIGNEDLVYTAILSSAFSDCSSLVTANLIAQQTCIAQTAFAYCTSLRSIDISNCTWRFTNSFSLGDDAFRGCTRLRSVALPTSTTNASYFGTAVFEDCTALESISIPDGATTLTRELFANATSLCSIDLPDSITSIDANAFNNCASLSMCDLPVGLQTIGIAAFQNCPSLTYASLGDAVASIGAHAFEGSGLEHVIVPAGVRTLTSNAFDNCDALTDVQISEGVATLAANTFSNCDVLRKVSIPASVVNISNSAFANCPELSEVWFAGDPPAFASNAFADTTSTAFHPIDNKYWTASDLQDYGGSITWTPYGNLATSKLTVGKSTYTGFAQEAPVHVITPSKLEVSSQLYDVRYFHDEDCMEPVDATDVVAVGTYYVTITGKDEMGCSGTLGPVAFEITKAPLTISYVSETIDEDATPVYQLSYDGFVEGEDESVLLTPAEVANPIKLLPGHSYDLTPEGATSDNYDITFVKGTLTVRARPIERPVCAAGLVYTGKTQIGVESGTGYTLAGTTKAVKAGEYTATVKLADGYIWADGSSDELTYTWSIEKATLTASFVNETINPGEAPSLKVGVIGFVNGETASSASEYVAPTATVASTLKPGYAYTARVSGGSAANYAFTYVSGKVTVSAIAIEEPEVTRSFTYDGKQKTALSAGTGYELSGVWAATDAGSYTTTVTLADGYEWSDGTRDVKEYVWRIHPKDGSLTLAESEHALKVAEAARVGYQYAGDGSLIATSSNEAVATAKIVSGNVVIESVGTGTTRVTVTSSACANYSTPAPISLTVYVTSFDLSECTIQAKGGVYAGKPFDAQVKVITSGGGELEAVSSHALHYYDSAACINEIVPAYVRDVGTYWVRAEALDGGKSSGHTNATSFTIEPATLTATYAGETIAYGATPKLKVTVTGFVNRETADTASSYVAPVINAPETLERATDYTLSPTSGFARNYTFEYVSGTLTVRPQVIEEPVVHQDLVFTGASQTGVTVGEHCVVSGMTTGTSAQSYSATITPESGCVWPGGSSERKSINWSIAKADIAKASALSLGSLDYTGAALQPRPVLALGTYTLTAGRDYTLSYKNNTNAGTATVEITGLSNFTGSTTMQFNVCALGLDADCVSGVSKSYAYTGNAIEPNPIVTCAGSTLERNKDYVVAYANNLSAGTASLTVTGKGNYKGSVPVQFEIKKISLEDAKVTGVTDATYTGASIEQDALVTLNGAQLELGVDYSVAYKNNVDAGIASVTFSGLGDVSGTLTRRFVISPASIATATVEGVEPSYEYNGKPIAPKPQVILAGKVLEAGTDYLTSYSNNDGIGAASITITGKGNYAGEITASFALTKAPYDLSNISLEGKTITYDGKGHSLSIAGNLPIGVSVRYEGNDVVEPGEHTITATLVDGDNEVVGSLSAVLVIERAVVQLPQPVEGLVYTGERQMGVAEGDLYTVSNNTGIDAGTFTAQVRLKDKTHFKWDDDTVSTKYVSWSIGKATLVASYEGESVMYGNKPQLVVDVTGFVNGESALTVLGYRAPTMTSSAVNAGKYRLTPTGGSAKNYQFDYAAGTLTITQAPVIVVAHPQTKVYGQKDPELTYTMQGANEQELGAITLTRTAGENVGSYRISISVAETNNYKPFVVGSVFTITKASYELSGVSFAGGSFTYDGKNHSVNVQGDLPAGVSVRYEGNDRNNVGDYTVTAYLTGDDNHEPIASLCAPLTIVPKDVSKLVVQAPNSQVYSGVTVPIDMVVRDGAAALRRGIDYDLTVKDSNDRIVPEGSLKDAGNYDITVVMRGNYSGSKAIALTVRKAANPMRTVTKKAGVRVKLQKVKKKKVTLASNVLFTNKAQGSVTYANVSKGKAKKLKVNARNGKVTVPKKTKKGTYKVKIMVTAAGDGNYLASSQVVTYKIVVK